MCFAVRSIAARVTMALVGASVLLATPVAATTSAEPAYEPPVPVTGTMNADAEGVAWEPAAAGADVIQEFDRKAQRGGGYTWTVEMDDPRLSGVAYGLWSLDKIGPKYEHHEGEAFTSTVELVNDDGSWVGSLRGYATMKPATRHWHIELTGTDGYEGLSALLEGVGPYGSADLQGLIFPGSLPEYPAPVELAGT